MIDFYIFLKKTFKMLTRDVQGIPTLKGIERLLIMIADFFLRGGG